MNVFNFAELYIPWQFVPTLFLITGLVYLWLRVVWLTGDTVTSGSPSLNAFVGPAAGTNLFGYYFNSWPFNPNNPSVIIKTNLAWLLGLTTMLELGVNYYTWSEKAITYFEGSLIHSPWIAAAKITVLIFMWLAVLYVDAYEQALSGWVLALAGTLVLFMGILVSANNFITFYVALEGVSLLSFVLAAQPKTPTAAESGLKYFLQSSLASILLLAGIALLFASTQSFDFLQIRYVISAEPLTELTIAALFLITVAMLFKVSAFPGHFWAPDVYRGPLASILTVFAVVVKAAAMLALFNIYSNFVILTNVNFSWLLYISSAASMLLGALGAIRVINERGDIRTFIAWTSVNQVGFVLLGLVCFSGEGLLASFVYLLVYLISSLIFVGVLSRVRFGAAAQTPVVRLEDLRSLFASKPYFSRRTDAFILAYSVWSMAGLPPLAGFFGKLALWSALVRKMSDLLSGDAALEAETAFPFVNYFSEFDPFWALGAILMFSIVISIIGATYYFKLYELLSPAASTSEVSAKQAAPKAYMMHDLASIFVTILLMTALSVWVCFVCWDQIDVPFNFPDKLRDLVLGTWSDDFDDMTPFN